MRSPLSRIGLKTRVFLGVLLALAVLAGAWDWNWFRHPAEQYFIKRSHRQVSIGDLHISLNRKLEPTVRLRGLYVENAPWADKRPFATAGEVSFTFSLKSLSQRRPVVSKLVLIDADIDLERQEDGHRNWRLRNPEDVRRGRMKVMHLEARDTRIRFVRRDVGLEVVAAAAPLEPASKNAGGALTTQILFEGSFKDTAFSGEAHTSDVITILESGTAFPIRGHMESGETRLDVDGVVADLFKPSGLEGKVRLRGPSLAKLRPFVPGKLPASRPYDVEAQVRHAGNATLATRVRAKVGSTLLTGAVGFDRGGERPLLKVDLSSDSADFADLASVAGARPGSATGSKPEAAVRAGMPSKADAGLEPRKRLLPARDIAFDRLQSLDAEFRLFLKRLKSVDYPALESLKIDAELRNGLLSVKRVDLGIAEGHLAGSLTLDARSQPEKFAVKLDGRDMRLEKLLAGTRLAGTAAGPVAAHVDLAGEGSSLAGLLGTSSGSAGVSLENGVISGLLNAAMELDLGKVLSALIRGNKPIGIDRIDIAFDFDQGVGRSRNFVLDTEQTHVLGTGRIDLRKEELDLVLTPQPKNPGLFALDSAIRVNGQLGKPDVGIVARESVKAER